MAKRIVLVFMLVAMCLGLCACGNMKLINTTYRFDTAIINLADGSVVRGKVQSWGDCSNCDQIQVKVDGKTYLVHSSNVTLIAE